MDARPIFVVGAPRSGTTMLRYMLCGHSRIYVPPESNFIPRFFGRDPHAILERDHAIEIVRAIESYRVFFKDWRGELPDPAELVDGTPVHTPAALVDALYRRYAAQHGAGRWGDKSPIYTRHVDVLAAMFPAAQFIHIVRDGRDVAQSMLQAYTTARFFYVDVYYAARTWCQDVRAARESGARLGASRYKEVRYEELVTDPSTRLEEICAFLGERFEAAMAHPEDVARRSYHSKGIHAATRHPVTTERAGAWRTQMAARDLAIFHAAADGLLAELGYDEHSPSKLPVGTLPRYAALRGKYATVGASRSVLRRVGLFHPTEVLARHLRLRPYAPRATGAAPAAGGGAS